MLLYSLFMFGLALFFYGEGKRTKKRERCLLREYCKTEEQGLALGKLLHIIALSSAGSGLLMLFCFGYRHITNGAMPLLPAALSFLLYGIGFMYAMYRFYQMQNK